MGIGHTEILVIIAAVLLIFGGRKIPELMRGIGSGMREFKQGLRGEEEETKQVEKNQKNDSHQG